ncbi:hypothetical protein AMR74_05780 [Halorubrum tropicale]|uniref:Uncharacterized protein n=1 Tax=Halorubrum tropicale TaxID=1765655 RepID=A0A0M9AQQ8_9EURY|nr:hypothetical protein AMR74_05780 [Halorubrum tropicale]
MRPVVGEVQRRFAVDGRRLDAHRLRAGRGMYRRALVVSEVRRRDSVQSTERAAVNAAVDLLEFRAVRSHDRAVVRLDLGVVRGHQQHRAGGHRDDDDPEQPDDFQLLVVEIVVDVHADLHRVGEWGAGVRAGA